MNTTTRTESMALATKQPQQFDLSPQTFEQALTFAKYLADSDLVPKNFQGKPGNCLIAMQWGAEVGMKALQSMQSIAVINGKPGLYGDAGKALLLSHGCIIEEDDTEKVLASGKGRCKITRPGRPPVERTFSMTDAKVAGLLNKDGPWKTYPQRQLAWRAFWFAARDAAADILRGMGGAEEIMDTPKDMGMAEVVSLWTKDQITAADEAAAKGAKAYVAYWKALGTELQQKLAGTKEHQDFKDQAQRADAARTVDTSPTPPAATPAADPATGEIVTTVADVRKKLEAAKSEDALYVSMDWLDAVPEAEREAARPELEALFNTRLAAIRGE